MPIGTGCVQTVVQMASVVMLALLVLAFLTPTVEAGSKPPEVDVYIWGSLQVLINATDMTAYGSQEFTIPFTAPFATPNVGVVLSVFAPKVSDNGLYYSATTRAVTTKSFNVLLSCNSLDAVVDGAELEVAYIAFHFGTTTVAIDSPMKINTTAAFVADVSWDIGTSLSSDTKYVSIPTNVVDPGLAAHKLGGILATPTAPDIVETFSATMSTSNISHGYFDALVTRVDLFKQKHWYQNVGLAWLGWYEKRRFDMENTTFGTARVAIQSCETIFQLPDGCYCTHKYECASLNCEGSHCVAGSTVTASSKGSNFESTTHTINISYANFSSPPQVIATVSQPTSSGVEPEQILSVIRRVTATQFDIDVIAYVCGSNDTVFLKCSGLISVLLCVLIGNRYTNSPSQHSYEVDVAYALHTKKNDCNISCVMGNYLYGLHGIQWHTAFLKMWNCYWWQVSVLDGHALAIAAGQGPRAAIAPPIIMVGQSDLPVVETALVVVCQGADSHTCGMSVSHETRCFLQTLSVMWVGILRRWYHWNGQMCLSDWY